MRNVLITGITGELGESICKLLIQNNFNVIGTYNKNMDKKNELEHKYNIEIIMCDLTSLDDINSLVSYVINKYEHIDILINNAAFYYDEPLEEKTKDTFMKVLDTNLVGPFLLSREIAKCMLNKKYGKIINIASTNGIDTYYAESIDYDASKAGLINLTKNMAKYYAPYITVNAIAPGWFETSDTINMDKVFIEEEKNKILLNRFGKLDEISDCVLFLCNNDYINSSVIRVDGGVK